MLYFVNCRKSSHFIISALLHPRFGKVWHLLCNSCQVCWLNHDMLNENVHHAVDLQFTWGLLWCESHTWHSTRWWDSCLQVRLTEVWVMVMGMAIGMTLINPVDQLAYMDTLLTCRETLHEKSTSLNCYFRAIAHHEKSWWLFKHFFVFIAFHDRPWRIMMYTQKSWKIMMVIETVMMYHELPWCITNPYGKMNFCPGILV